MAMILGSATKAFVASNVMKMVEQGKLSLDDFAFTHIDPVLQKGWNTSMFDIFGLYANGVTVRHLMFMTSGIMDYEVGTFDSYLLEDDQKFKVHSPIEAL